MKSVWSTEEPQCCHVWYVQTGHSFSASPAPAIIFPPYLRKSFLCNQHLSILLNVKTAIRRAWMPQLPYF